MQTGADTADTYIAQLPSDRKAIISSIRDVINHNIPAGFEEKMCYGMIGWVVPHSLYPAGYHCDPTKPLALISLASQKNYISLYHMGLYAGPLVDWFRSGWPHHSSKKLDMGKSCIRFKTAADVPLALIGELATKLTPQAWIETYEAAVGRAK